MSEVVFDCKSPFVSFRLSCPLSIGTTWSSSGSTGPCSSVWPQTSNAKWVDLKMWPGVVQFKTEKRQICSRCLISSVPEWDCAWTLDCCYTCVCERTLHSFKQLTTAGQILQRRPSLFLQHNTITQLPPQRGFAQTRARALWWHAKFSAVLSFVNASFSPGLQGADCSPRSDHPAHQLLVVR